MIEKIVFSEFFFRKNKSIEIKGFSGHEYSKDNKKPNLLITPTGSLEKDIVRTFIKKLNTSDLIYVENYSVDKKMFRRPRRLDFVLVYRNEISLIDVIDKISDKMKVVRKINDQISEIEEIKSAIILLNKKIDQDKIILNVKKSVIITYEQSS
jgi:hypothetical protein